MRIFFVAIVLITLLFFCFSIFIVKSKGVDFEKFTPFSVENDTYDAIVTSNIPKISSAIAYYPFASRIVENTCSKIIYSGELQYLSTYDSYESIINHKADIAICSKGSKKQMEQINSLSDDILLVPIAKDALVFYINKEANVKALTKEDINSIYSTKIRNWKNFGGNEKRIFPFQLEYDVGGSEACFSSIVDDSKVVRKKYLIAKDMKDIIDLSSLYNGGIGYAFNQFYSNMYNFENLSLISIDNYEPSNENFKNGNYPLMFEIYFVYRKSNSNENVLKILNWLRSEEGTNLILECNLQPITEY